MTIIGLSVSLVALLFSLFIFFSFKSLKCARITVHMNMFSSMTLNNISWLMWYRLVLLNPESLNKNQVWCRVLHVFTTYFMLTTYFWMLCEGIFLRMFLVNTIIRFEDSFVWFLAIIGWIFPCLSLIPYVWFRTHYENELCWMDPGRSIIFLAVPAISAITINIFCLCNVIKVIQKKFIFEQKFTRNKPDISLKSARAVLILIPIFGVHFLLFPMRPEPGSNLEYVYEVFSCISTSTQGLSVSFLLCFCNNDISSKMKRKCLPVLRLINRLGSFFVKDFSFGSEVRKPIYSTVSANVRCSFLETIIKNQ